MKPTREEILALAIEGHRATCAGAIEAVHVHPTVHHEVADVVEGVPVVADPHLTPDQFRLRCSEHDPGPGSRVVLPPGVRL